MTERHIERMVVRVRGVARTDAIALAEAAAAALAARSWSAVPAPGDAPALALGPLVVKTTWHPGEAAAATGARAAALVTGQLVAPRGGRP